jgi:lysophospholipase L1-like esterase
VAALATLSLQLRREQAEERKLQIGASALYYMPGVAPGMTPDGIIAAIGRYNEIIREVARETGALLIESAYNIPGDAEHFTDAVHFTAKGGQVLAEIVAKALSESESFRRIAESKKASASLR